MRTLLRNGRIHGGHSTMLLDGGTIGRLGGDDHDTDDHADRTVDLAGAWVTPAFVDSHVHVTQTGLAITELNLAGAPSLAAALDAIADRSRATGGRPILGTGWDDTAWPERRPPTSNELDRAAYGGLVYLARVDHHSAVASSALLAAAPDARGMLGWSDSGHVRLEAHHEVRRTAYSAITPAQREAAQRACRQRAAELGIACLHEMSGPKISGGVADLEQLLTLAAAEPGPEVIGYWGELDGPHADRPGDALSTVERLGLAGAAGDLFCDGSLGSHTAALLDPYADDPGRTGHRWLEADAIAGHLAACTAAGVQGGFHAIGDAAIQQVLLGAAAAAPQVGRAAFAASRHRVEHLELLPPGALEQLKTLGLFASVQPAFDTAWGGTDGMYAQRLGADRAAPMNPFGDFARHGIGMAFGSDSPVTPLDPWGMVRGGIRHRTPGAGTDPVRAFAAATADGWRAARRQGGELAEGAPATYAVWDAGDLDEHGLPDLTGDVPDPTCLRLVLHGETIYER
jgi:predicted amidohydrolase YtcJ